MRKSRIVDISQILLRNSDTIDSKDVKKCAREILKYINNENKDKINDERDLQEMRDDQRNAIQSSKK